MCSLPLGDLADGVKCKLSRWPGWKGRAAVQGMEGLEEPPGVSQCRVWGQGGKAGAETGGCRVGLRCLQVPEGQQCRRPGQACLVQERVAAREIAAGCMVGGKSPVIEWMQHGAGVLPGCSIPWLESHQCLSHWGLLLLIIVTTLWECLLLMCRVCTDGAVQLITADVCAVLWERVALKHSLHIELHYLKLIFMDWLYCYASISGCAVSWCTSGNQNQFHRFRGEQNFVFMWWSKYPSCSSLVGKMKVQLIPGKGGFLVMQIWVLFCTGITTQ